MATKVHSKRKKGTSKQDPQKSPEVESKLPHNVHSFSDNELVELRQRLLKWYDKHKRDLPWRVAAKSSDTSVDQRAYAVLVSELMLQQTQVATVMKYYDKWMERWPSLTDLAAASLDDVYKMWKGLGYYSRGRRLHEIACKVHNELDGNMPSTAKDLAKLPGVGPYTAGAVASIVFSEQAAVVDGNVIRVMARLRAIGACSTTPVVTKALWKLAEESVDAKRPGDFNQALMELGATVCTPKNPQCDSCPVSNFCLAKKRAEKQASKEELADIEEVPGCSLCLISHKWDSSLGVMNYPRKEKKTLVRQQETAVCVLHRQTQQGSLEFFLEKRPEEGLLANLWQFPNIDLPQDASPSEHQDTVHCELKDSYGIAKPNVTLLGRVSHQFSHISQVYVVFSVPLQREKPISNAQAHQWTSVTELQDVAIPTGMKKVFKLFNAKDDTKEMPGKKRKCFDTPEVASRKNKLLTDFFTPQNKKS